MDQACFAAGEFQSVAQVFEQLPGVSKVTIGFTGGILENPTLADVEAGQTGHAEAVLLEFDADQVSYKTLCKHFFGMHDQTTRNRQGKNVGDQYRSAIFLINEGQRPIAESAMDKAQADFADPVVTQIEPLRGFYQYNP